jgi:hypothetical protein
MSLFGSKHKVADAFNFRFDEIASLPFVMVQEAQNSSGQMMYDYESKLIQPLFGLYDHVIIRMFQPDLIFHKDVQCNAFFSAIDTGVTLGKLGKVVNQIADSLGKDSNDDSYWTDEDMDYIVNNGDWLGRSYWFDNNGNIKKSGDSLGALFIEYNADGCKLSILGFNVLVK